MAYVPRRRTRAVSELYAFLREREALRCQRPDTVNTDGTFYRRSRVRLQALDSGEPVEMPVWDLPSQAVEARMLGRRAVAMVYPNGDVVYRLEGMQ